MDKKRTGDGKIRYALYLTIEELACAEYFLNSNAKKLRTIDFAKLNMKRQIHAKVNDVIREISDRMEK